MNEARRTRLKISVWYEPGTDRDYLTLTWVTPEGRVERCFNFRLGDAFLQEKVLGFVSYYQDWEA